MFTYLLTKSIRIGIPLTDVHQIYSVDVSSVHKDTHVRISMHSHFWRHTLIHHHRSMTIGLNIDVPVTSEKEQTRSHDSTYSKEILR